MLEALGLIDLEERFYLLLVKNSAMSAAALSREAGVSAAQARRVLGTLEKKGLVSRSVDRKGLYVAAPPVASLEVLALQRQEELQRVRSIAQSLEAQLRNAERRRGTGLIEVVEGQEAIVQRYEQLLAGARHELRYFDVPPYSVGAGVELEVRVARRVRSRCIYDSRALNWPGKIQEIQEVIDAGEEDRFLPELPMQLVIADDEFALMPLNIENRDIVKDDLLVHAGPLLQALIALFEALWEKAVPFWIDEGAAIMQDPERSLSAEDAMILSLVAADAKDEAIARHLGISRRTVQRRIYRLMDLFGAKTRLQLAVHATRGGII